MTLNNAVTSYRGNASCIVDDPSRFNCSMWLDPKIQKFVPLNSFKKHLWDNRLIPDAVSKKQQWQQSEMTVRDCPNVIGYRQNEKFDAAQFLYEESFNWGCHAKFGGGRSVMLPALRILFQLGFRRVYLLGVDFEMTMTKRYHFPEDRPSASIRGNMETYAKLQRWFAELQPYFLHEGFIVKNCNHESKLKAFPFVSVDDAVAEAKSILGDFSQEQTVGMYKPIKEKVLRTSRTLQRPRQARELAEVSETGATVHGVNSDLVPRARRQEEPAVSINVGHDEKRRLILRNFQAPGDIVMLTAAIRDLHKCYPEQFETDVRTSCNALWENNPFITQLSERDRSVEVIPCHYPLIHRSNTEPWHFIHGFIEYLNGILKLQIRPTAFMGDIHLSPREKGWMSQVQEVTKERVPFWIIGAGGKRDYTIKWWSHDRFQAVVDHFKNRILFVQVGESGHEHPPLKGVLDLRGQTDLRQLVRLVYHAQGILCPVTLLMHLSAAVETREGMPKNRPCVVVAGGREPAQWEAYPHHQFIHTNGALHCCDNGGCWKSRVAPLGDGDEKDKEENLCINVVQRGDELSRVKVRPLGLATSSAYPRDVNKTAYRYPRDQWKELLPKCMDIITADDVIERVEMYFIGGAIRYLNTQEAEVCKKTITALDWTFLGPQTIKSI